MPDKTEDCTIEKENAVAVTGRLAPWLAVGAAIALHLFVGRWRYMEPPGSIVPSLTYWRYVQSTAFTWVFGKWLSPDVKSGLFYLLGIGLPLVLMAIVAGVAVRRKWRAGWRVTSGAVINTGQQLVWAFVLAIILMSAIAIVLAVSMPEY